MSDIHELIKKEIRESLFYFHVNGKIAEDIADAATARIRKLLKGNQLYFPAATREEKIERRQKAVSEYNGRNGAEICQKYHVSKAQLYAWVKASRRTIKILRVFLRVKTKGK